MTSTKSKTKQGALPNSSNSTLESRVPSATTAGQHPTDQSAEHHHEYVSQDGFETSYQQHSYRSERDYDRYSSSHTRDRYARDDDSSVYRDKRGDTRDINRDKYSSVRYDKDRSGKHHHYHRKRDRSRDHSHERSTGVGRRDRDHERMRDYDRARDRDRDRRDRERDYRERERERLNEHERPGKARGNLSRYNHDYGEITTAGGSSSYPSSGSAVYYPLPTPTHLIGSAPTSGSYDYHSYGYGGTESQPNAAHVWHAGGSGNWTAHQAQLPPQPPLPPPPPDGTPNWDEPEPPPPGGYSSTDEANHGDQTKQRKGNCAPSERTTSKIEDKPDDDCSTDLGTVDLDTRIALMFKGKSFGNAPPFLQMDSSESETEKGSKIAGRTVAGADEEDGEVHSDSNERPSAKRHSKKAQNDGKGNLSKKMDVIQHGASDISSSDDEILLKKDSYSPILPDNSKKDDDRMSLSSLSSTDHGNVKDKFPQTLSDSRAVTASYIYPANTNTNTYYYPGSGYPTYPHVDGSTSAQYFPNPAYIQSSYLPGISGSLPTFGGTTSSGMYNDAYRDAYKFYCSDGYTHYMGSQPGVYEEDPYKRHIEEVVQRVSDELKQILKRDFNKKMIENTAFKNFEAWWDDQMKTNRKHKSDAEKTSEKSILSSTTLATSATVPTTTRLDKPPDINQLINSHRDLSDFNSGYPALGLRASIPKLPSFRRIRKQPSPKSQKADDEKRLSDQEEMVQGSDSEKEDSNLSSGALQQNVSNSASSSAKDPKLRPDSTVKGKTTTNSISASSAKRKGSSSSFFSSSSSSEADNEDDEEDVEGSSVDGDDSASDDDLSSITDDDVKSQIKAQKGPHKNRNKQRTPPARDFCSDSDEDDQDTVVAERRKPVVEKPSSNMVKSSIYSDTEEETDGNNASNNIQRKTELKTTALVSDLEDISKDSSFSVGGDETQDCKKMANSNDVVAKTDDGEFNPSSSLNKDTDNQKKEAAPDQKKSVFEYDRIYSDSEEEREYQEKRRRNTEYMAQIEREFLEEQQLKLREEEEERSKDLRTVDNAPGSTSGNGLILALSHNSSGIEMPETPDISKAPPTPGAKLISNDLGRLSGALGVKRDKATVVKSKKDKAVTTKDKTEQAKTRKDQKAAKAAANVQHSSPVKQEPPTDINLNSDTRANTSANGTALIVPSNGYAVDNSFGMKHYQDVATPSVTVIPSEHILELSTTTGHINTPPIDSSQTEEENEEVKMSPTSSDGGSSQASQASQVALEHCYSLPPQADTALKTITSSNGETAQKKQQYLAHDHGGYATPPTTLTSSFSEDLVPPEISQQLFSAAVKPGPGRPRKDSARSKKKDDTLNQRVANKRLHSSEQSTVSTSNDFKKSLATFEPIEMFKPREATEEMMVLYEFLTKGIDAEDIQYVRRCYEIHLQEDTYG